MWKRKQTSPASLLGKIEAAHRFSDVPLQAVKKVPWEVSEGPQSLRLQSYRVALPRGRGGFGRRRNHSLHFSRPSALADSEKCKNLSRQSDRSHFVDTQKRRTGFPMRRCFLAVILQFPPSAPLPRACSAAGTPRRRHRSHFVDTQKRRTGFPMRRCFLAVILQFPPSAPLPRACSAAGTPRRRHSVHACPFPQRPPPADRSDHWPPAAAP